MKFEWEQICDEGNGQHTSRAKVPGGWLIRYEYIGEYVDSDGNIPCSSSITFVPGSHAWDIE